MYNYLLNNGDSLKELSHIQRIDLQDYVNMRERCIASMINWKSVRSFIVTKQGDTLWQLYERYLDSEEQKAIGIFEPPLSFLKWILSIRP